MIQSTIVIVAPLTSAHYSISRPVKPAKRLKIFCQCTLYHLVGQAGRGCLLVPLDAFKIVAHKLLVEGGLSAAGLPCRGFPEAGGVGRQHFIRKDNPICRGAKLKFCVCQDQAARLRMFARPC